MTAHGGPDALGAPRWDFSTNANACGPAPAALHAVQTADATRYPDPAYTGLRDALAALHGVSSERIVPAASASEFITRMTAAIAVRAPRATVHAPRPGYGDYAAAARAAGLRTAADPASAQLVWHTDPASPGGFAAAAPAVAADGVLVVDLAYAPLRLDGSPPQPPAAAWQLWSPNKTLGLTGVRGAYAIAPAGADALRASLAALAPSWPLGAHAVAMLGAWALPATQAWVRHSVQTLRAWDRRQRAVCAALGWHCAPSDAPFLVAHWPAGCGSVDALLPRLRRHGVKLRDCASMGLPGRVRVSVQPPAAQDALCAAWRASAPDLEAASGITATAVSNAPR